MPSFLTNIDTHAVYEIRVEVSMANSLNWIFSEIVGILDKQIQRARCEEFLINIADAFDGYELWFPAFVDFRGRIYRTGFQHFHERDLARSLILFSSQGWIIT
jgi:DNA-directed RNA polymerase